MNTTITGPTRAGFLEAQERATGTTLVAVNGVEFGDPIPEGFIPVRDGLLFGRGLNVESIQHTSVNAHPFTLVTVWMGSALVTLTLNPGDQIVLGTTT